MTYAYLKEDTDRLRAEKLPLRVIYRDEDGNLHAVWATIPTADNERYIASQFPGEPVEFHAGPEW